jgi:methylglutaconyl-CoA hydratase
LEAAIEAEIAPYLAAAPGAVAAGKGLIAHLGGAPSQAQVTATVEALIARWEDGEAAEGIAAFFDKTPPPWAE